jgi:hypothetical protein
MQVFKRAAGLALAAPDRRPGHARGAGAAEGAAHRA